MKSGCLGTTFRVLRGRRIKEEGVKLGVWRVKVGGLGPLFGGQFP